MGQHSMTNLYPVLHYLQAPLKYICTASPRKARLIERKYHGVKATTSLDEVLRDSSVKGIIISASLSSHFGLASQVLQSGKSLFIEKPPCQSLQQLRTLIELQHRGGSSIAAVGLQKRYAPAVQLLKKRLSHTLLLNYDLHYLTGSYPEGNPLLNLYIHPLDLVCYLFGAPTHITCQPFAPNSFLLMLQHPHILGTIELSTTHSWAHGQDCLTVHTHTGTYHLSQTEDLTFIPRPTHFLSIPFEKMHPFPLHTIHLQSPNHFSPILTSNPIYTQGYFSELQAFLHSVETQKDHTLTGLSTLQDTFSLLEKITKTTP